MKIPLLITFYFTIIVVLGTNVCTADDRQERLDKFNQDKNDDPNIS